MLRVNQLVGFGARRRKAALPTYDPQSYSTDGSRTTYTFSGVSLGAPAPNRVVVVPVYTSSFTDRTISSATIGGVSATVVRQEWRSLLIGCHILAAAVPTGSTGNVVITFSGAIGSSCGIMPIAFYGIALPAHHAVSGTSTGTSVSSSLNVPARGAAVAVGLVSNTNALSWTGVNDELLDISGGGGRIGVAALVSPAGAPSLSVSVSSSGSAPRCAAWASFPPL